MEGVKKTQGRREEELVTYLPGLYTPLDPPDAEVRLEEEEEEAAATGGEEGGGYVSGKQGL